MFISEEYINEFIKPTALGAGIGVGISSIINLLDKRKDQLENRIREIQDKINEAIGDQKTKEKLRIERDRLINQVETIKNQRKRRLLYGAGIGAAAGALTKTSSNIIKNIKTKKVKETLDKVSGRVTPKSKQSNKFSFRAQSLDNQSPDPLIVHGKNITNNIKDKEKTINVFSKSMKSKPKVFKLPNNNSIKLWKKDKTYVLKIETSQKDVEGRIAPVLIHGFSPSKKENVENIASNLMRQFEHFNKTHGRALTTEERNHVFDKIKNILNSIKE